MNEPYVSRHFDKDKLAKKLDELIDDQVRTGWSESTAIFVGCTLDHAIKVIVTREEGEYYDAESMLKKHPNSNCLNGNY